MVDSYKREYLDLPSTKKVEKARIAARIVSNVRSLNPPGRFLKENSHTNNWLEIGDERAWKKSGQALRESAPEIRAGKKGIGGGRKKKTADPPAPRQRPLLEEEEEEKEKSTTQQQQGDEDEERKKCNACGGWHKEAKCWKLHPELAPEGWRKKNEVATSSVETEETEVMLSNLDQANRQLSVTPPPVIPPLPPVIGEDEEVGHSVPTIIRKKFVWKDYPKLEEYLIAKRTDFFRRSFRHSTSPARYADTVGQQNFNNRLTEGLLELAAKLNYVFDETCFDFASVRNRIRTYYTSKVYYSKKQGVDIIGEVQHDTSYEEVDVEDDEDLEDEEVDVDYLKQQRIKLLGNWDDLHGINKLICRRELEQRASQQQGINYGSTAYEVLGIPENCAVDDIKAAYCAQTLVHHHFRASDEYKDIAKQKMEIINEAFSIAMNNKASHNTLLFCCHGSKVKFATERNSTDDSLHLSIGTILPCFSNPPSATGHLCRRCYIRKEGQPQGDIGYQLVRSLITIGYPFIFNNYMRYGMETSKCETDMHFIYDERSCAVEQDDKAHKHYRTKDELNGLINRVEFVGTYGGNPGSLTLRNNCRKDVIQDHLQVILIDALIREWKKGVDMKHSFVDKPIVVFIDYRDEDDYPDHNFLLKVGGIAKTLTSEHLTAARGKYGDRVFSVHCRDSSSNSPLGEEVPNFVELALYKIFPWCRGEE